MATTSRPIGFADMAAFISHCAAVSALLTTMAVRLTAVPATSAPVCNIHAVRRVNSTACPASQAPFKNVKA